MNAVTFIKDATLALVLLVNAGIAARIAKILVDMTSEEEVSKGKKKIKNCVKAVILANVIVALITVIKKYYISDAQLALENATETIVKFFNK